MSSTDTRATTATTRRGERLFTEDWRFRRGDEAAGGRGASGGNATAAPDAAAPDFDDSGWREVELPHDWSIEGPFDESLTSATAYLPGGIGWYRRRFSLAGIGYEPGARVRIRFDGVYNNSTVWCNGVELGTRPFGYSTFSYDVTDALDPSRDEQVIAVRVDHSEFSDSRWYTGSGIYRNVWLTVSNPVHVAENGVFVQTPAVSREKADVRVETTVANESADAVRVELVSSVIDAAGVERARVVSRRLVEAGADAVFAQRARLRFPSLWSTGSPSLYRVRSVVLREHPGAHDASAVAAGEPVEWINGVPVTVGEAGAGSAVEQTSASSLDEAHILDHAETPFGIRYFAFDPDDGFTLNGEPMKLKGVCVHHDAGCFGAAVPKAVWARRLRILKETGCNAIRFSHNPPAPEVIDLCDELGLLTMDEAFDEWELTKNKWVFGHNQGEPSRQGYGDHFAEWHEADLEAMVLRDRNHPSIVMWSIGNEIDYPNDPYTHPVLGDYYKSDHPHSDRLGVVAGRLASMVRALDPTRPVTAALAAVTISNRTGFADALDVCGYNYLERHYDDDHAAYPQRIIYGSENGQSLEAWAAVRDNDWICGQFLWTGIDFLGEARGWPVRNSQAGYLDTAGFRKPAAYFRTSLWSDEPMVWLGALPPGSEDEPKPRRGWGEVPSWNWPDHEGAPVTVVCHTNCDEVELVQDGASRGVCSLAEADDHLLRWQLPWAPGRLVAKGYRDGELVATAELATSGAPHGLVAAWGREAGDERSFLSADGRDLIHVELTVVDEHGVPVPDADGVLTLSVEGPARVVGLENGDPASHEPYGVESRRAYRGRLLAVVRSAGGAGTAVVTVTGEGLEPLSVEVPCV